MTDSPSLNNIPQSHYIQLALKRKMKTITVDYLNNVPIYINL